MAHVSSGLLAENVTAYIHTFIDKCRLEETCAAIWQVLPLSPQALVRHAIESGRRSGKRSARIDTDLGTLLQQLEARG